MTRLEGLGFRKLVRITSSSTNKIDMFMGRQSEKAIDSSLSQKLSRSTHLEAHSNILFKWTRNPPFTTNYRLRSCRENPSLRHAVELVEMDGTGLRASSVKCLIHYDDDLSRQNV